MNVQDIHGAYMYATISNTKKNANVKKKPGLTQVIKQLSLPMRLQYTINNKLTFSS